MKILCSGSYILQQKGHCKIRNHFTGGLFSFFIIFQNSCGAEDVREKNISLFLPTLPPIDTNMVKASESHFT